MTATHEELFTRHGQLSRLRPGQHTGLGQKVVSKQIRLTDMERRKENASSTWIRQLYERRATCKPTLKSVIAEIIHS